MALGRKITIDVGPGDDINLVTGFLSTRISGLDCAFNIIRSDKISNNKANFKIYNASADTRNNILKVDNNILMSAGYADEGNEALIFAGNITEVYSYRDGPDWVSDIKALSFKGKDKNTETKPFIFSYEKDVPLSTVVSDLAVFMGLALVGIENVVGISLPNGFNFSGSIKSALQYAMDIAYIEGVQMSVDNQDLVVYTVGIPTKVSRVVLSYDGPLISINETSKSKQWVSLLHRTNKSKKTLLVETLLDPRLAPTSSVFVDAENYVGTYVINSVNYYGDNFAGDFNCKIKVQSLD